MKRLLLLFTFLTLTFTLFACGDDDFITETPPTFSHLIVDARAPAADGDLETYIKNKDEAIVVEVHFNNPSNAPINSVTINGQRYRTNRFEEGSSSTVVILNLTLRVTGETLYEVENFVYSDVNSVNVTANNTYQVFVLKNLPTASLSNLEQGSERITTEIRVTDEDSVTLNNRTVVELYQGETLIDSETIIAGVINSVTFDTLLSDQSYTLRVFTDYDLEDGSGVVTDYLLLEDDTLNTLAKNSPTADITLTDITEEQVDFSVNYIDISSVLVEAGLDIIITQNDTVIDTITGVSLDTLNHVTFEHLLNNNTYTISIYATYDLNDDSGVREDILLASREFTTLQRPMPSINAELVSITEDTMRLFVDDTNITTDVELSNLSLTVHNDDTDELLTTTNIIDDYVNIEIAGLFAHTFVRVTITASFDLGDGQGMRDDTVFEAIYQTSSNEAPSASIESMSLSQRTVSFTTTINDTYNTIVPNSLKAHLYEDNVLIDTITLQTTSGSYTFLDQTIYQDKSYRITITTDYDLRDGEGVTEDYQLGTFVKTAASPKAPEGTITLIEETNEGLVIHYTFYDYDNTLETAGLILHYHDEILVLDALATSVTLTDYHKGVTYDFELIAHYNTTKAFETVLSAENYTTTANQTPTVETDFISTDESISGDIIITDPDQTLDTYTVTIYRGTTLIHTQTVPTLSIFDLLSDTEYRIEITFTFDLNDTQGMQETTVTTTIQTQAKAIPTLTFNNASIIIDETSVQGSILIDDPDQTLESYVIALFKDGVQIDTLTNQTDFTFTNLDSDTAYTIRLFKNYDLNKDGVKTNIQSDNVSLTTTRYEAITIDTITESTLTLTVDVTHLSNDFDLATLKAFVYDDQNQLLASALFTDNPFNLDISNAYADQVLIIVLEAEDKAGTPTVIQTLTTKTDANEAPSASITNVIQHQTTIDFVVSFSDPNETILTQPIADLYENGVLVKSLTLDLTITDYTFTDLEVNYSNTYDIRIRTDMNLRDKTGIQYDYHLGSYTQTSIHKKAPTITLDSVTFDYSTGISIDYTLYDFDDTIILGGVTLIYNGTHITLDETLNHPQTMIISDYYNEDSSIQITVVYQDRYGDTVTLTTQTEVFTVDTLTEPTYTLTETVAHNSISGAITWTDIDSTLVTYSIYLYHNDTLVDSVTDVSAFNFTGLYSDETYTIEVTYQYDLNEITGPKTETTTDTYHTNALALPTVTVDSLTHTLNTMTLDISVSDTDATLNSPLSIMLYNGATLVDSQTITGTSTVIFSNLTKETTYTIVIEASIDQNLSTGVYTHTFTSFDETTPDYHPEITYTQQNIEQERIEFYLDINDIYGILTDTLVRIELYDEANLLVGGSNYIESDMKVKLMNLYSDHIYTVKVYIQVDYQDGAGIQEVLVDSQAFTTLTKTQPTVTVDESIDETSIKGTLTWTDPDLIKETHTIALYQGETLITSVSDVDTFDFTGLYSNETYTVIITYTYNLNDGQGVLTETNTYTYTTDAYTEPTVTPDDVDVTDDTISGNLVVTDPDNRLSTYTATLYLGETVIDSVTDVATFNFTGLYTDTPYDLIITYTYNLEDGNGVIEGYVSYSYHTDSLTVPTGEIDQLTVTGTTIAADISMINDPDNVLLTADVVLYADNVEVERIATVGNETVTFATVYDSNVHYVVKLIITYDLNDREGPQTLTLDQVAYIEATKN